MPPPGLLRKTDHRRERATVRERMQIERETETERPKMQKKKKMVLTKRMVFEVNPALSHDFRNTK
jgi:hypothetical protein